MRATINRRWKLRAIPQPAIIETEIALRQRHAAGIEPVGDIDIMFGKHGRDRAAQQGGIMARHRGDDQHLGVGPAQGRLAGAADCHAVAVGSRWRRMDAGGL